MALPDPLLIKSIFNHHAPSHDGAVILSQDRLTHMGCILPLSENEDLPEHYGTRHRAAIGLSELSDAICLVVSEERSEVASVVGGKISIWKQPESLQEKLKEWLGGPEIDVSTLKTFLEDFFIKNWKTKLAALALVSSAWLALASHQQVEIAVNTPIRHLNPPLAMVVDEGSAKVVNLTLSGRSSRMDNLRSSSVRVNVDLTGMSEGEHFIKLAAKNVQLPSGVRLVRITPQRIQLTLIRKDGKTEPETSK
jgi:hypothetical protein